MNRYEFVNLISIESHKTEKHSRLYISPWTNKRVSAKMIMKQAKENGFKDKYELLMAMNSDLKWIDRTCPICQDKNCMLNLEIYDFHIKPYCKKCRSTEMPKVRSINSNKTLRNEIDPATGENGITKRIKKASVTNRVTGVREQMTRNRTRTITSKVVKDKNGDEILLSKRMRANQDRTLKSKYNGEGTLLQDAKNAKMVATFNKLNHFSKMAYASIQSGKSSKNHKYKDTNIIYQSSYELHWLNKQESLEDVYNSPSIKYRFKKKSHMYYPDFYIKSSNTIVEIKSKYVLAELQSLSNNIEKFKSVLRNGFNLLLVLNKVEYYFDSSDNDKLSEFLNKYK